MTAEGIGRAAAEHILFAALDEGRAEELLMCLFDGGSATVDHSTGHLVLVTAEQLRQLVGE